MSKFSESTDTRTVEPGFYGSVTGLILFTIPIEFGSSLVFMPTEPKPDPNI